MQSLAPLRIVRDSKGKPVKKKAAKANGEIIVMILLSCLLLLMACAVVSQ